MSHVPFDCWVQLPEMVSVPGLLEESPAVTLPPLNVTAAEMEPLPTREPLFWVIPEGAVSAVDGRCPRRLRVGAADRKAAAQSNRGLS